MDVLCLSKECDFLRDLIQAFGDGIVTIDCKPDAREFLDIASSGSWTVFFIDFDALPSEFADPLTFVNRMRPNSRVLVVGSSNFTEWHKALQRRGVLALQKPTTIGEIGLALRKLATGRSQRARGAYSPRK